MADVPISTQELTAAGIAPTLSSALSSSDTMQVVNDGKTFLRFVNSNAAARTVTFLVPRMTDPYPQRKANWPLAGFDPTRTVPALDENGSGDGDDEPGEIWVAPPPRSLFGETLEFTVSGANVQVAAIRVPHAGRTHSGNSGWEPSGYPEPEGSGS